MPTTQPKSGVTEYTTSTGSGAVTLSGAAPGYRQFVSADDGKMFHYAIRQAGTTFEVGRGTYTHSSRLLSRDTVFGNINGTTSPLTLGDGTKEVSIVLPGEMVAMLDCVGEWAADQRFNGKRLYLDADSDSWAEASIDDTLQLYLDSALHLLLSAGTGVLRVYGYNDTSAVGPELALRRYSATPAASDLLGQIRIQGTDSDLATQTSMIIRSYWTAVTAGAHSSAMDFWIAKAGALQKIMVMESDRVVLPVDIAIRTNGKTVNSVFADGAELRSTGEIVAVTSGSAAMHCYRNTSDGDLMVFGRAGSSVGIISVSGGTVTYGTFTGGHYSEWAPGQEGDEHPGTVVATAEGLLEHDSEQLPLVRMATAGDRAVYGVIAARVSTMLGRREGEGERSLLLIHGLGLGKIRCTGPIQRGDLLRVSATPGVAEAQDDDLVRSTTIAKATQSSMDDGSTRLVPCVLMAA